MKASTRRENKQPGRQAGRAALTRRGTAGPDPCRTQPGSWCRHPPCPPPGRQSQTEWLCTSARTWGGAPPQQARCVRQVSKPLCDVHPPDGCNAGAAGGPHVHPSSALKLPSTSACLTGQHRFFFLSNPKPSPPSAPPCSVQPPSPAYRGVGQGHVLYDRLLALKRVDGGCKELDRKRLGGHPGVYCKHEGPAGRGRCTRRGRGSGWKQGRAAKSCTMHTHAHTMHTMHMHADCLAPCSLCCTQEPQSNLSLPHPSPCQRPAHPHGPENHPLCSAGAGAGCQYGSERLPTQHRSLPPTHFVAPLLLSNRERMRKLEEAASHM